MIHDRCHFYLHFTNKSGDALLFFSTTLADICTNVFSQSVKEEKKKMNDIKRLTEAEGGGRNVWEKEKTVKTFGSQQRVCSLAGLQISKLSGVSGGGVSCLEHQPTCLNKAPCRDKRYPREGNINWGLTVYGIKKSSFWRIYPTAPGDARNKKGRPQ